MLMRNFFLLLFGLLFISILSYFAFKAKGEEIQQYRDSAVLAVSMIQKETNNTEKNPQKNILAKKIDCKKSTNRELNKTNPTKETIKKELKPSPLSQKAPMAILEEKDISKKQKEKSKKLENTHPNCQNQLTTLLANKQIAFVFNTSRIKNKSYPVLNKLLPLIKFCKATKIIIAGYTDSIGKRQYNQKLSLERANAIKKYFVQRGVLAQKIETIGYGEKNPIADNRTKKGREQNRRIEIFVKGNKS